MAVVLVVSSAMSSLTQPNHGLWVNQRSSAAFPIQMQVVHCHCRGWSCIAIDTLVSNLLDATYVMHGNQHNRALLPTLLDGDNLSCSVLARSSSPRVSTSEVVKQFQQLMEAKGTTTALVIMAQLALALPDPTIDGSDD
jgi:hypothetical protein